MSSLLATCTVNISTRSSPFEKECKASPQLLLTLLFFLFFFWTRAFVGLH